MTTRGSAQMNNGKRTTFNGKTVPSRSTQIHSLVTVFATCSSASVGGDNNERICSRAVSTCIGWIRVNMIALFVSSPVSVGNRNLWRKERVHSTMTPAGVMRHEHVAPMTGMIDGYIRAAD